MSLVDHLGRPIINIDSEETLRYSLSHLNDLPTGAIHIISLLPFSDSVAAFIEALITSRPDETCGITFKPSPELIAEQRRVNIFDQLVAELNAASRLPEASLLEIRQELNCADRGGSLVMLHVSATSEDLIANLTESLDIHQWTNDCPVARWYKEALEPILETATGLDKYQSQLSNQIRVTCVGGLDGSQPNLCHITRAETNTVRIGHGFCYILTVAARICAARTRLATEDPLSNMETALVAADRLSQWYIHGGSPRMDTLAFAMNPTQLYVGLRLLYSMRRFIVAHELSHVIVQNNSSSFRDLDLPWDLLDQLFTNKRVPRHLNERWQLEIVADMIAFQLLLASGKPMGFRVFPFPIEITPPPRTETYRLLESQFGITDFDTQSAWDFAGVQAVFTLWKILPKLDKVAGRIMLELHPPAYFRDFMSHHFFPMWYREFGINLGNQLGDVLMTYLEGPSWKEFHK